MSGLKASFLGVDRGASTIGIALLLLLVGLLMPTMQLPRATYDYIVVFDISHSPWPGSAPLQTEEIADPAKRRA